MALSTKPTKTANWNTGLANQTEPSGAKKILGWELDEPPASSFFNWLAFITSTWFVWIFDRTTETGGGANLEVHPPAADTSADSGGALVVRGGNAGGDAATTGGSATLQGGDAASGTQAAGAIVSGGDSTGSDVIAGTVNVQSGQSTGNAAGTIQMRVAEGDSVGATPNVPSIYATFDGPNRKVSIVRSVEVTAESGSALDALTGDASGGDGHGVVATADSVSVPPNKAALLVTPQTTFPTTRVKGGLQVHATSGKVIGDDGTDENRYVPQMFAQIVDSNTIANTTTETVFDQSFTIPANTLRVGSTIRLRAYGGAGRTGSPTLDIKVRLDSAAGTLIGFSSVTLGGDGSWVIDFTGTIRSTGPGGVIQTGMNTGVRTLLDTDERGAAYPTDASHAIVVTAKWGTASASNAIQMRGYVLDVN